MTISLEYKNQFKKDIKLMQRRGKDPQRLWRVVELLLAGIPLPLKYRDHRLSSEWAMFRECHIEPDWLLIYELAGTRLILVRTGTHADLF